MDGNMTFLEILELLKPKIKRELMQTNIQNRADLEQEIMLKILEYIKNKDFQQIPSFFDLMDKENQL